MLRRLDPATGRFGPGPDTGQRLGQRQLLKKIPGQQREGEQGQPCPTQQGTARALLVAAAGAHNLLFSGPPRVAPAVTAAIPRGRQWPQGLALGFYDGVAGPGTGAFWTVSNLLLYPLDLLRASGVARSMNFVSNAMALTVFIVHGQVAWLLGICMGLALMAGAFFGARTAIKGGNRFIRPVFILVVLALTARLAWQHWFGMA